MSYARFRADRRAKRLRESMEAVLAQQPIEIIPDTDWHVWPENTYEITEEAAQESFSRYSEQA